VSGNASGAAARLHVRVQAYRRAVGESVAAAIQDLIAIPVVADTTGPTQAHRSSRRPDVVVIVGSLLDSSTSAAVRTARRRWPLSLVIALAETHRADEGVTLVRQGADAWLAPNEGLDALRSLLMRIAAGERVLVPPTALGQIASTLGQGSADLPASGRPLTSRESQVLECFTKGLPRDEIADLLGISQATLRTHVQNILRKLDVHSIDDAISVAVRDGVAHPSAIAMADVSAGMPPVVAPRRT